MPVGVPHFVGRRLTEARVARGIYSSRALADLLGRAPSTIGRWEDGSQSPEPAALTSVATLLRLPEDFFLEEREETKPETIFFRSFAAALKSDRALQSVRLRWLADVTAVAEHYAYLPEVNVPDLLDGRSYRELRQEDIERYAIELREHWTLGLRPIENMVDLAERQGIVVACEHMETDRLDGLSKWQAGRAFILLANDKNSFARRQYDVAHELAHLVLHRDVPEAELAISLKQIEEQADRFAASFLLPADQYPLEVRSTDMFELERLKARWKTSIKAQIMRLRDLGVITAENGASLFKRYSAKGYASKGEPYDDAWPLQCPRALAETFTAIVDGGSMSKADLLQDFLVNDNDVESLAGLPIGWFKSTAARVITLKPRPGGTSTLPQRGQVVHLPFNVKSDVKRQG